MVTLKALRQRAEGLARHRGHSLAWETPWQDGERQCQNAICWHGKCFAEVQIITRPLPNEADVGGSGVAGPCPCRE